MSFYILKIFRTAIFTFHITSTDYLLILALVYYVGLTFIQYKYLLICKVRLAKLYKNNENALFNLISNFVIKILNTDVNNLGNCNL